MKKIELIKNLELGEISRSGKSKEVKEIFKGTRRHLIEVTLRSNEILAKHKASEPITVLCLAGSGTFRAGSDLEDEEKLEAGTLLTLEAGVEHEVRAEPELRLLITKFKDA
jgi:quercetin dioxygenase-like cupin family protein